jgi:enoyl-CoA hydratase
MGNLIDLSYTEDGAVGWLRLMRPESMNAVSPELLRGLEMGLNEIEESGARICIIAGSGRAFSAGADLQAVLELSDEETNAYIRGGDAFMSRLERGPLITIAAVDGYALGGGAEIALACNICVASPRARFGLPELLVGTLPGWGGVARLARVAPRALLLDVVMSGRRLKPEEAQLAGIVSSIAEDVDAEAADVAARLLKAAPHAQLLMRGLVEEIAGLDIEAALARSLTLWLSLMRSAERLEGHTAFIEKRPAKWTERALSPTRR